jgi:hypothetical protein
MIARPPCQPLVKLSILSWDAEGLQYLPLCVLFPPEPPMEAPHQRNAIFETSHFLTKKQPKLPYSIDRKV